MNSPDPKHDLEILFGIATEPLVEDLGVPLVAVEIAEGDTYYFSDWYEARAAIMGHPPRVMPQLSPERPIFWWFQPVPATTWWGVIEFTLEGVRQVAVFTKASRAYERVLHLRNEERKRQRRLRAREFVRPPPTLMPQPPYRCICGIIFDTAQELLDHRCGPQAQKESP
jgi:hypothetical protein